MAKSKQPLSGLAVVVRGNGSYGTSALAPYIHSGTTPEEQQIALETQKQLQIIRNQRLKTDAVTAELSQMHQHGADEFYAMAAHLAELSELAGGKEHEALVKEFNKYNAELAANNFLGAMRVGAHTIAEPIGRPIEVPIVLEEPEPAPKSGFFRRLLGD